MSRADELFIKNYVKFLSSQSYGSLKPVLNPSTAYKFKSMATKELSRKFVILEDISKVPPLGDIVATKTDSEGYGIAASTTGIIVVEKTFRSDFISWLDALDLIDHFENEPRNYFKGAAYSLFSLFVAYRSLILILNQNAASQSGSDLQNLLAAPFRNTIIFFAVLVIALCAFGLRKGLKEIFGPKNLYFGDKSRFWSGLWFLDRNKIFAGLRRGALVWEKAQFSAAAASEEDVS